MCLIMKVNIYLYGQDSLICFLSYKHLLRVYRKSAKWKLFTYYVSGALEPVWTGAAFQQLCYVN